jgi:hypothetical protein
MFSDTAMRPNIIHIVCDVPLIVFPISYSLRMVVLIPRSSCGGSNRRSDLRRLHGRS